MDNGTISGGNLLRLIGLMGVAVGIAWALQILMFGNDGAGLERFAWILSAAVISGAGVGLMVVSGQLPDAERAIAEA